MIQENMVIKTDDHTFYTMGFNSHYCPFCDHWDHKEKAYKNRTASEQTDSYKERITLHLSKDANLFVSIQKKKSQPKYSSYILLIKRSKTLTSRMMGTH